MLVSEGGGAPEQARVLATLATAEQKALTALLGTAKEWPQPPNKVGTLRFGAAEAAAYFAWLAEHLTDYAATHRGRANAAIDALASPVLFVTLKRTDKEYASLVHPGDKNTKLHQALAFLTAAFSTPPRERTSDNALDDVWKTVFSSDVKAIGTEAGESRLEFEQLVRIIIDHCQRSYLGDGAAAETDWPNAPAHTNQFTRRALAAWRDALEAHQVRLTRGATSNVNVYPYIALRPLPFNPDQLVLLAVTPFDPWFVDDRVPEDRRMPEILLAVYDTPAGSRLNSKDLRELETTLAAHLGRFTFRLMASRRGDALANSAGEGSEIARYWFGQGVSRFLRETEDGGLEFEDVVQFWRRFIEELLCANIEGVQRTETFPFDRAYLIRGTPARPLGEASSTMTVIETAVQSRQADTNFQYLTSSERDRRGVDLEDLNLTQKKIKFTREMQLVRDEETDCIQVRYKGSDSKEDHASHQAVHISMPALMAEAAAAEDTPSQWVLASLMSQIAARPGETKVAGREIADLQRRVRANFDQEGLLYDFHAGVAMKAEAPLLAAIDGAYRTIFVDDQSKTAAAPASTNRDAKFVLFCFEPSLANGNQRAGDSGGARRGKYFLGPEHAITVILVADIDVEKGIQEITSERGDLQVLIQMILQQRLRDRRREASTIDSRVSLIESVLGSFVHKFVNLIATGDQVTDKKRGEELHQLRRGLERIIRFDQESLIPASTRGGAESLANFIWYGREAPDKDLQQDLRGFIESIVAREAAARGETIAPPIVEIAFGSAPPLSARLPLEALKECIEVVLSNAVQASVAAQAPKPARLYLSAQAYALPGSAEWVWDFSVENTTAPIPPAVWSSLTSDEPAAQETVNREKSRSTGVGVYMARQLLRSAFGRRSDIRYFLLEDTRLRASLQAPVQIIAPSLRAVEAPPPAPVRSTALAQLLYIEDNPDLAARTQGWLSRQLPHIGAVHAATRAEVEALMRQSASPRLIISDLSIPDQPGGAPKKLHGAKALESVLIGDSKPPVWIFTGNDWRDANSVLTTHLRPAKLGYTVVPVEDGLLKLDVPGAITILPSVKTIEEGANDAPFAEALRRIFDVAAERREPQPATPSDNLMIFATAALNDGADQWQERALAKGSGMLVVDARDGSLGEALQVWTSHGGFPEITRHQSSQPTLYPLWDSTVHRWVALRAPCAKNLPIAARYWCLCHNIAPTELPAEECANHWSALISEATGPLGLVRHEIANMRGAALSESSLFQTVRERVTALENVLRVSAGDEAILENALTSGAIEDLVKRLSDLGGQQNGDPVRLFGHLEQALIDLLKRTEDSTPGEAEELRALMQSVHALDRLIAIRELADT